tara:strand:- start:74 stop:340 length:267 start_codon:yes stop_codon:yes gene_type:complete
MNSSEKILEELIKEKNELNLYGNKSLEVRKRIEDIDFQIKLIKSGDSFREHELEENCFSDDNNYNHEESDDNDYGYVSESFHDPDKDY